MNTTRASVDFTRSTAVELPVAAQTILEQMTANTATFPAPPVSMAQLGALIADYATCLAARASRAKADVLALTLARQALLAALGQLGNYVNLIAQGDPILVQQSGFPSYGTARSPDTSPPAAPDNVRLSHGVRRGEIIARYNTARPASTNEVQLTTGNPNLDESWQTVAVVAGQKAFLSGLTPGTNIWVRLRTAGLRGVMGAWSDPAEIMVI